MATTSVYTPAMARLTAVRGLTELEKLFTIEFLDGRDLGHAPGQFVMLSIPGVGEAPISVTSSPSRSNGRFELCVRRVGDVTGVLHGMPQGATVGVRGPFGRGFPLERIRGRDVLLAAGGLGLVPLRSLINQIIDERGSFGRVIILYGTKAPAEFLFVDEIDQWTTRDDVEFHLTVDRPAEGWDGHVGPVTTLFPGIYVDPWNTVAVTCGPPVMYRFVLIELLGKGISEENIFLSLERRMRCGVGKCGHCQINDTYCCKDGPVFSYAQLKNLPEAL
jgi:sulfhydrogenase subunit gamma (sulfur reductase)